MGITIVGLGPGAGSLLTEEARRLLEGAQEVYLRTQRHPVAAEMAGRLQLHSFDHILHSASNRDRAVEYVVGELLRLGQKPEGVVYAVPGDPLVGDATVAALLAACRRRRLEYRLAHGLSFLEPACAGLGLDAVAEGLQLADALAPQLEPQRPALIFNVAGPAAVATLKAALLELYPADHMAAMVDAAAATVVREVAVADLEGAAGFSYCTCLYLPPLALAHDLRTLGGLRRLVAHLRGPQGCPWDRVQTHASLRPFLLEEAYEALEALDDGDGARLREELGDLLLEVLLHVQIAEDEGEFRLADVVRGIASKLVRRHPHVFGDEAAATPQQVMDRWEALKQAERGDGGSALDGVPTTMPALAYSQALLARAARVGFQWPNLDGVL
ncbi:MAG: MazG family protein, partial [Dehalococcoidia bacterium]